MPFERFYFSKDWTAEPTDGDRYFPTHQDSEGQVRKDLQLQPDELKNAINALLDKLESAEAAGLIGDGRKGNVEATLAHLYSEVERLGADIERAAAGETPESMLSREVSFKESGENGWVLGDGVYTLTVPKTEHYRKSAAFGCLIWAKVDGVYRSDVWYGAGTAVEYVDATGDILLTAEEPYTGKIVFFGV